ncbi:MAG: hypothetical protein GX905_09620 [Bacteroidales bacterium]|nr:hypothetical protein [Bacteroidales bacterium]
MNLEHLRSKKVEDFSCTYELTQKLLSQRFRLLTFGLTDNNIFILISLSLISSLHEGNQICLQREGLDEWDSPSLLHRKYWVNQIIHTINLLRECLTVLANARVVCVDSCLNYLTIRRKLCKKDPMANYLPNKISLILDYDKEKLIIFLSLYSRLKKNFLNRQLFSFLVSLKVTEPIYIIIFFIHYQEHPNERIVLLNTGITFGEEIILTTYLKSLDIETFFKVISSSLHLNREFEMHYNNTLCPATPSFSFITII